MDTIKERFESLRALYITATDKQQKAEINEQVMALAKEAPEEFMQAFTEGAKDAVNKSRNIRVREMLESIAPMINLAYIAENYFHKSRAWFSQRLNGAIVNGQPATFKPEEIKLLAEALQDISRKIAAVNFDGIINH